MSRILAIDWDGVEARYALGSVQKDRLIVLSVGAADIAEVAEEVAQAAESETDEESSDEGEVSPESPDGEQAEDEENDDAEVVETVEKAVVPKIPVAYDDEEDEEAAEPDGGVVVSVKKSKRESFKTSPIALTLKKLLKENKVGKAVVCYGLERGDVDVMYMTIPQTTETETPEIVFNQALRDSLTFNESQPLDYMPLGLSSVKRTGVRRVAAASVARDKLRRIRETLAGAIHAPSKIELREPSLAEFMRADFCGLKYEDPVILIQELCDEVNLTLCFGKDVLYFRSFKLQADASPAYRAERIREEVVRTLVVGVDDLPENTEVNQAIYFTGEPKPSLGDSYDEGETSGDSEESESESAAAKSGTTASILAGALVESGINVDFINPFQLPGVKMKAEEPANPGRYASALGMILAERPQNKPAIDLLHPHEKPKPPNYALVFIVYFILVGAVAYAAWRWNSKDLARINAEITTLEAERDKVAAELNSKRPLYQTLTTANAWQNVQGVNVLDELRDIISRLPGQPDFVVQRLAYSGSIQGRPTFIISAKITSIEYFQAFRNNLSRDGSHVVVSRNGAVPNQGDSGYKYMFDANIVCARRAWNTFMGVLPKEIQQISNNAPEYFVQQAEERKREQEEAQRKLLSDFMTVLEKTDEAIASAKPKVEDEENPPEPTLEEDSAFHAKLVQQKNEIDVAFNNAKQAAAQGKLTQAQLKEFSDKYQAKAALLIQTDQPVATRIRTKLAEKQAAEKAAAEAKAAEEAAAKAEEERKAAEEAAKAAEAANNAAQPAPAEQQPAPQADQAQQQTAEQANQGEQQPVPQADQGGQQPADAAQNPQEQMKKASEDRYAFWKEKDGGNTAEQDSALAPNLLQFRKTIDSQMQQAQANLQQGGINQQAFGNIRMAYVRNVVDVEARWKALQERIAARNGQAAPAQTEQAPAPAEQAPAPEAAPAPAEQAPAPEAAPAPAEQAPAPAEQAPAPAPEAAPAPAPAPEAAPAPAPAPEAAPAPAPAPEAAPAAIDLRSLRAQFVGMEA